MTAEEKRRIDRSEKESLALAKQAGFNQRQHDGQLSDEDID